MRFSSFLCAARNCKIPVLIEKVVPKIFTKCIIIGKMLKEKSAKQIKETPRHIDLCRGAGDFPYKIMINLVYSPVFN